MGNRVSRCATAASEGYSRLDSWCLLLMLRKISEIVIYLWGEEGGRVRVIPSWQWGKTYYDCHE